MHYGYVWQPQGVTATQPVKVAAANDTHWTRDTDVFRRNWSGLQTMMQPGDTLTVNSFDALGPSIIGALNTLTNLVHRGISIELGDMGVIKVTAAGRIVTGAQILRVIAALAAAQTRMTLTEKQQTPANKRRGRPFKLSPAARLPTSTFHVRPSPALFAHTRSGSNVNGALINTQTAYPTWRYAVCVYCLLS